MDTSAGRYAVTFLMDGRVGMVCDIAREGLLWTKSSPNDSSASASAAGSGAASPRPEVKASRWCVCYERSPRAGGGPRSVYRNFCHSDDPPRSVAICPQRNCVAFGCGSGIELHWVDALAGQDLSRWFPLSSPSDFLYFMPARRGLDTAKRLRLISSTAAFANPLDSIDNIFHGFGTDLVGLGSTALVSLTTVPSQNPSSATARADLAAAGRRGALLGGDARQPYHFRRAAAGSTDHYRAVPLGDGYHILFTDPRTGYLCLGADTPVGSRARLLRKVWFKPPADAVASAPTLYAAGADTRHGVRVVAAFEAGRGSEDAAGRQVVVFYTVPPDLFHDMAPSVVVTPPEAEGTSAWQPGERYRAVDIVSEPFANGSAYPVEVSGQPVATCSILSELALDSLPEMIIWAFGAEGWAKTWAVDAGGAEPYARTAVQRDGSVRRVEFEGDMVMTESEEDDEDGEQVEAETGWGDTGRVYPQRYDGAAGSTPVEAESPLQGYFARRRPRSGERMSGTVSVDLLEEVRGIARLDVELR